MKHARIGVFETNSSSTHSLTICTQEEYDNWIAGKLFLDTGLDIFINDEKLVSEYGEALTYQAYNRQSGEEYFKQYTTKSGEKIVAFGQYS